MSDQSSHVYPCAIVIFDVQQFISLAIQTMNGLDFQVLSDEINKLRLSICQDLPRQSSALEIQTIVLLINIEGTIIEYLKKFKPQVCNY